ncbi:MAG: SLC13 family permease [Alphaproteobacteria bacterium]
MEDKRYNPPQKDADHNEDVYADPTKASYYIHGHYPTEDLDTEMFAPVFKRQRTWLVFAAFVVMALIMLFFKPNVADNPDLDAAKITLGIAIFTCIAFLWLTEAMPLAATALLVPILSSLFGVSGVTQSLASFANPLIWVFFGGFALASALAYQGIDKLIANRVVTISKGRMFIAAILLFCATAFLSMWMSNTATTAMMIPLILGIVNQLTSSDEAKRKRTIAFFLLGVAYAASIGGMGSIVGSPPNGIAAKQLGISFGEWLLFGIPAVVILLPVMIALLYFLLRPELSQSIELEKMDFKWTWPRKLTVIIFSITAFCWIFSAQIKPLTAVSGSFDTIIALSAVFALLYFRTVRWRDIDKGTDWGVLLLFGGGIALSNVLKETGSSTYLAQIFSHLVEGWPIIMIIGAVTLFVIFLTELSSNTATAALFVPIFYAVGTEMGFEPSMLVLAIALAASCAFMLPVATPPNAIVFGTGMVTQKTMMRVGIVLNLVFVVILTLLSTLLFG